MSAEEFFYANAGWSYDPAKETPEQGMRRCAQALAQAEQWAKDNDLEYRWEDDWDTLWRVQEYDVYDEGPLTCEACLLSDPNGTVLASLGCINDATPEYRRVIQAELALEAMGSYFPQLAEIIIN